MRAFLIQLGIRSLQTSVIICVIFVVRKIFDKMNLSKKYTNILWSIPYLCMILPWKIESRFSFWKLYSLVVEKRPAAVLRADMQTTEYISNLDIPVTVPYQKTETASTFVAAGKEAPDLFTVLFWVWAAGVCIFILYNLLSYYRTYRSLLCSVCLKDNIFLADDICLPFVFGFFKPRIYLPSHMKEVYVRYVVEHEKTHIQRKDYLKKMLALWITGIYWFHPFAWIAFEFMCVDMEMACDEDAVQNIGIDKRKRYAEALLNFSERKAYLQSTFLAFGTGNVKERICNILKNKKRHGICNVFAIFAAVVLMLGFLTVEKRIVKADISTNTSIPKEVSEGEESFENEEEGKDRGTEEKSNVVKNSPAEHSPGFKEVKLHLYIPKNMLDLGYVTKGLWTEEDMERLAQQAMRELYDLTGTQVEECYYYAADIGCFYFAMSKDDMDHSRNFCTRQFSDDERVIPSIYVANAKQVSYSMVDMQVLPEGYEGMTEKERAEWFVTHSGMYNGQSVKMVYQPYDWNYKIWHVVMEDDSAYEIILEQGMDGFSGITGPYPDSEISH